MKPIAIDIETMPNPEMYDSLPPVEVDKRLKDPAKIAIAKSDAAEKQRKDMALSPIYGMIASVAVVGENTEWVCAGEKDVLEGLFRDFLRPGNESYVYVTYNGISFDLPFIYKRALITGANTLGCWSLSSLCRRYSTEPHCDMRMVWTGGDSRANGSLNDVSKAVLGKEKLEFDVFEIPEMIKSEKGRQKLMAYNRQDAVLTLELYKRALGVLF